MKYLVSIIVPMYNSEKYIVRCIDSLLEQSYENIEIIVVDDGSSDNSVEIIKKYNDNRINIYQKRNEGVSATRNLGIEKSNGDFLLFVDSDDYVSKDIVKVMLDKVNSENSMILCNNKEIWGNRIEKRILFTDENIELNKIDILRAISSGKAGLVCSKLVSNRVIKENNIMFDESLKVGEDQLFFLNVAQYTEQFKYVNKSLYFYDRTNENSSTIKYQNKLYDNFSYLQKEVIKVFNNNKLNSNEDIELLNNKEITIVWTCINNEVNGIRKLGIKNTINNIVGILNSTQGNIRKIDNKDKIGNLICKSVNSKYKNIIALKLIIIINLFNLKIRLKNMRRLNR